jgi:hypothetical protein
MVLLLQQWLTIEKFVESNPQSRVAVLFKIRNKLRLLEQQGADRDMLGLLDMKDSPSHSFRCDIIHQLENYIQVHRFQISIIKL